MILQPIYPNDKEFRLLRDEETSVGRKECCVLIDGDPSISRLHAKFSILSDGATFLTDFSKYGTSVNNKKLNKNQKQQLKEGDLIKFGNQPNKSEFRLVKMQWVFCCSNMNANQKAEVKKSAIKLGGVIVDTWNPSCTHLIMNNIVVTVKVVNALSSLKPIVTPKWLEDCVTAVRNGNNISDHANYLPEVIDQNCRESKACFLPDESRAYLLSGKVFYFLTEKQHNRLRECITNGGGICKLVTSQESLTDMDELVSNNAIVMSVDSITFSSLDHAKKEWVQLVQSFVKSKGYRTIVDSEVGLALLSVSIEKNCNPLSHQELEDVDSLPPPTLSQQRDVGPPPAGGSLSNITVYANDTLFGSEPSDTLNGTPSTPRTKNTEITHKQPPVKREIKEDEVNEVPISLSVPPNPIASNGDITQSSTDANKYFEPQGSPLGADPHTPVEELRDSKEKMAPVPSSSPDGLSCSPSTFNSSLPSTSTSVIVPGTFTQKSSKDKDVKALSNFFSSRKRKKQTEFDRIDLTDDNVVDLTIDDNRPPPKTSTANTSINIFDVLSKRQKRGIDIRNKDGGNSLKPRTVAANGKQHTKDNNTLDGRKSKEAVDNDIVHEPGSSGNDSGPPRDIVNDASSINGATSQEHDSMESSDSQRPMLTRFHRFTRRKANGFMSARVSSTSTDGFVTEPNDNVPIAPTVVCEQVSLVVNRVAHAITEAALDTLATGVVNFKRFKKARYIGMGGLPTIIGTTDLVPFDGETTTLTQEWHREHMEFDSHVREESSNPFDMPSSSRRRRKQ